MNVNEKEKGMWKRTIGLFLNIKVPWHLYVLQVLLGIVCTKVGLLLVPYESKMQTGNMKDTSVIWGYLGFTLLYCIVYIFQALPTFYSSAMVTRNLQNKLISRALRMPLKSYEKNASRMVSWVTQDCSYADGVITSVVGFITGLVSAYMSVTAMSAIDRTLVYLVPFVAGYIVLSTWLSGKLMFLRQRRARRAASELTAYLAEHLGYFLQIKQMHSGNEELERGTKAIDSFYRADLYQAVLTLIGGLVSGSLDNIITILVFVLGIPKVRDGSITITDLAAFQSYILLVYQNLSCLPSLYTSMMYYNGTLFYISKLMAEHEEVYERRERMDHQDENLTFEHVCFSYDEESVIKNADFTIPKGRFTVIVGPNGSGKTTLFKLIERFYEPDSGRILFGDCDVEELHLGQWRQSFGYVLQDPMLFDGTIRENIVYGMEREVTEEEVESAARLSCADEFIKELPGGYDFVVGENGSRLSGGQRQRIAIARALLLDPSYLLLDEATCSMDVHSEQKVLESLLALMKGRTTVMITHDMGMLERADEVIVMKDGAVEAFGPVEEVKERSDTLQKLMAASAAANVK
jgi:ATP-binding cassette subfamily B protein AbcA/BmrA